MSENDKNECIIFGIGNSGRQDDGLGWLFLDYLKNLTNKNVDLEYRYQLQIEDAELLTKYKTVVFVDATKNDTEDGFYLEECYPSEKYSFSTHALKPETILHLANKLYNHHPKASILGIQGHQWELKIGLSTEADLNLLKAKEYFKDNVLISYP